MVPPDFSTSLRRRWIEGRLAAGLGRFDEAEAAFRETRQGFIERGIGYDAALASLDLAALYASRGSLAEVKVRGQPKVEILRSDDPVQALLDEAARHDLIVLGLKGARWSRRVFGEIALRIARESPCPTILLSAARPRAYSDVYRPLREAVNVRPWRNDS